MHTLNVPKLANTFKSQKNLRVESRVRFDVKASKKCHSEIFQFRDFTSLRICMILVDNVKVKLLVFQKIARGSNKSNAV